MNKTVGLKLKFIHEEREKGSRVDVNWIKKRHVSTMVYAYKSDESRETAKHRFATLRTITRTKLNRYRRGREKFNISIATVGSKTTSDVTKHGIIDYK